MNKLAKGLICGVGLVVGAVVGTAIYLGAANQTPDDLKRKVKDKAEKIKEDTEKVVVDVKNTIKEKCDGVKADATDDVEADKCGCNKEVCECE